MAEVMKIIVTSFKRSHACTATLTAHNPATGHYRPNASTGYSWTFPGKSGSVFCGVIAPFSWVLVHITFHLCPPKVYFPVLFKFWQLYGGVNGNLLHKGLCHTQVCCTQRPIPVAVHHWPIPPQEMLKHSTVSVSVGSLAPGVHMVCLSSLSIPGGNGVWFQMQIYPLYHLAGVSPLHLGMRYLLTVTPAPYNSHSSATQPCLTQWKYEPCRVGPPKMDRSWWRVLTKCGPFKKGTLQTTSVFLPWEPHEK